MRRSSLIFQLFGFLLPIGAVVTRPSITDAVLFGDIVLVAAVALALAVRAPRGAASTSTLAAALPWIWVFLLGSVLGLIGVGLPAWAVSTLATDVYAFALLFATWKLTAHVSAIRRGFIAGGFIALVLVVGKIAVDGTARSEGTFRNPNYAGHFLAIVAVMIVGAPLPRSVKVAGLLATTLGILRTGSLGALAMMAAAVAYALLRGGSGGRRVTTRAARIAIVATIGGLLVFAISREPIETDIAQGVTEERYDRSANTRFNLWTEGLSIVSSHPLGVGPYGIVSRDVLDGVEIHNDVIGLLVERGLIGLIGMVGVAVTLWRHAPRGGLARLLLVTAAAGGIFRETLHFRHLVLALGLAFALDQRQARSTRHAQQLSGAIST